MRDLSHWNMASDFSINEVACISAGIEPNEHTINPRVRSIMRLLNEAYLRCRITCEGVLNENEVNRLNGREEAHLRFCPDVFESYRELPSRTLRNSFAEALRDPETRKLVTVEQDDMRFLRGDLEQFFKECDFEPDVLLFDSIFKHRESTSSSETDVSSTLESSSPAPEKSLSTLERNTLLKLVIGLAVKGYGYDPTASKSGAPREIADDLAALGITVTDDTVRKYLKQAAETQLPAKLHQS